MSLSKIPRNRVASVIAQRSLDRVPAKRLAEEIAAYLLLERRTSEQESLLRDVLQYRADHGFVEVLATSAHALTAGARSDIRVRIKTLYPAAKQIIISEQLDVTQIGGIRLELANQQFDATIRTKLNHFKQLTAAGKD